ncbi:invasion associated locus B family protein [Fuscovulum ytuae]|uniref:Invasion associated locus B family protein n=1 Tax=Fuscovulum ytuae TaxID=3042299 RepID=A0ABY8QAK1_9RHOB|nr:invasion associated locus B family protein [Fuscovulum sp. YMD61]WGV17061.1 invasion associated locus B family protein [Fuscovulum sp. YMD61]
MSLLSLPRSASFALTLGLTLLGGSLALAQETTDAPVADAASPEGLSMGQSPAEGPGSTYVKEAFSDWELRCIRVESGAEPCQLYQLLKDGQGTSVAEIGLFSLPEGGEAAAGATIIVPLETLLTQGLRLGIDAAQPKIYPFTFCSQVGCVARVGFTAEEVEAFRKGNKAVLTIVPAVAPDQTVSLDVSLAGFTAGFEAVKATLAEEAPAP